MVMPPHHAHRAPHHTPQPLIRKTHPAAAHHAKAPRHAAATTRHRSRGGGSTHRATVIAVGNPATVQIHGSDATAAWPLAANISVSSLSVGQAVVGTVFNPADPNDALLTAIY
jgi:hypothetical protein